MAAHLGWEKQDRQPAPPALFYGWVVVAICVLVKIVKCQGQNNIMTYTVPHLREELQLSDGELGVLFSVATISASSVQPLFGRAIDKFGGRVCIPAALMCFCLALLSFSGARRPAQTPVKYLEVVVLFFFIRALALGVMEVFPSACVQKWFVRRRGRALSIVGTLQMLGNGLAGEVISRLVARSGWRAAARVGSLASLALAPAAALLLRRSPEACGLAPDGDGPTAALPAEELSAEPVKARGGSPVAPLTAVDEPPPPLPPGLTPLFVFVFFYSVIFGGSDFEMVGMVAEAGGKEGGVNVAEHVFVPLALVGAVSTPILGEVLDRAGQRPASALALLGLCSLATSFATNLLCYAKTPALGVTYGAIRGLSSAIFAQLCTSGMVFAALGVTRDNIGRILGINQFACLAGTGVGPLLYGTAKDTLGSFRQALQLSSLPPLFLGISFLAQALSASRAGPPGVEPPAQVSPVYGRAVSENEVGGPRVSGLGAGAQEAA